MRCVFQGIGSKVRGGGHRFPTICLKMAFLAPNLEPPSESAWLSEPSRGRVTFPHCRVPVSHWPGARRHCPAVSPRGTASKCASPVLPHVGVVWIFFGTQAANSHRGSVCSGIWGMVISLLSARSILRLDVIFDVTGLNNSRS